MARHAESIIAATILAILIWVFAEAESLRRQDVTIELIFDADRGSERVIDLVDPSPTPGGPGTVRPPGTILRVAMTVEGTAGAIDGVERLVRGGPVRITPASEGVGASRGEFSLPLRTVIRNLPQFGARGVTIRRMEPEAAWVLIDDLVSREVPIRVIYPEGDLEGQPEATPRAVRVTAPTREAARLGDQSAAVLRIDDRTWSRLVPGRRETIPGVRLELPEELKGSTRAVLAPASADVSLTVRSRTASIRLPSVPVHIRVAPAEYGAFDVVVPESDQSLLDVTVSGPADLIRQIEERTIQVVALVPLSFDELERGITSKEAIFSVYPTALRFETPNRVVRFTITRREPTSTAPPRPSP